MSWLRRLFIRHEPLPATWKPHPGTWSDRDGVTEGRCEPMEPYVIPPRRHFDITPAKPQHDLDTRRKEA